MTTEPGSRSSPTLSQLKEEVLKPLDAWWVVFVGDPIAIRLVWALLRLWPRVTPNAITGGSLVAGLFAAIAFAKGWYVTGAFAYQVSFILDCTDGKLARWRRLTSRRGEYWDGLVNTLVFGVSVLGLTWHEIDDRRVVLAAFSLLIASALHVHTAHYVRAPAGGGHPVLGVRQGTWLARHRLLPPLTFFDKIALLFFVAPLADVVLEIMAGLALLDVTTWLLKARIAWRDTRERVSDEVPPALGPGPEG